MAWRKTSALGGFLPALAEVFRALPPGLLAADGLPSPRSALPAETAPKVDRTAAAG